MKDILEYLIKFSLKYKEAKMKFTESKNKKERKRDREFEREIDKEWVKERKRERQTARERGKKTRWRLYRYN